MAPQTGITVTSHRVTTELGQNLQMANAARHVLGKGRRRGGGGGMDRRHGRHSPKGAFVEDTGTGAAKETMLR